jgi:hypothetical protein
MSKLWGANRKGGDTTQLKTSTVRGKISAPIPIQTEDDEFPIRAPVVGLAIPFGYDNADTTVEDGQETVHSQASLTQPPPLRDSPQRPSGDAIRRSTTAGSRFRESGLISPLASPTKPERRKGSFRAALGRLFGKKPKGGNSPASNGHAKGGGKHQHHKSVSILERVATLAKLTRTGPDSSINDGR